MTETQWAHFACKSFIYAIDDISEFKCKENKRYDCSVESVNCCNCSRIQFSFLLFSQSMK